MNFAIAGSAAFSDFRLCQIQDQINAIFRSNGQSVHATAVRALWVYYVHRSSATQDTENKLKKTLLRDLIGDAGYYEDLGWKRLQLSVNSKLDHSSAVFSSLSHIQIYHVFPRIGTISPWSSKATNIAKVCGLKIDRIERG